MIIFFEFYRYKNIYVNKINFETMKNNQYIQKYGEKALQLLNKRSLKHTALSDLQIPSDSQIQLQQKQNIKKIQKCGKSSSHKSLHRQSKSKSKLSIPPNQNHYTFQKPINIQQLHDKQRKKIIISGLSTPKNNRSARMVSGQQEKIRSSSTKKKPYDITISQKLNQVLKNKSTKSIVKQLLQCLDMISQHEYKINKWIAQFKDIVYHISDQALHYRKKYKEQVLKHKKIQKDLQQLQANTKINIGNMDKKRKPIELVVMEQNQKLKDKVNKLQQKIQNYQRKQMILIDTLQKMKNSKINISETKSSIKKQQNNISNKIKREFYGNQDQDDQEDDESQEQQQENL